MSNPQPIRMSQREALENSITAALEQQPAPAIPLDFASRVAARAAAMPQPKRTHKANYARSISALLSVALLLALFVLAPHVQPTFASVAFDLELALTAVLAGVVYMLTRIPRQSI